MLQMRYENIFYLGHLEDNTYFVRKDLLLRLHRNIIFTCTFFVRKKSTNRPGGPELDSGKNSRPEDKSKISSIPLKNFPRTTPG